MTSSIPLRRLIKRPAASALLAEFQALSPETPLALVGVNGRLFAGAGPWEQGELEGLLRNLEDENRPEQPGLPTGKPDALSRSLSVEEQNIGHLLAGRRPGTDQRQTAIVLDCLADSLQLLLVQAAETRQVVRETLDRYREINLLYQVAETIGSCLDPGKIPQLILDEALPVVPADAGAVFLTTLIEQDNDQPPGYQQEARFGAGDLSQRLANVAGDQIVQVLLTGRPLIFNPLRPADSAAESVPDLAGEEAGEQANGHPPAAIEGVLCAPLKTASAVYGVLTLGRVSDQPEFTAGDEKLVMALTGQAAIALETAHLHQQEVGRQRMEEELAIGRQIQLSFLPERFPEIPGWEMAATYQAAREVGGDFYDFMVSPLDPALLLLVIADVTGKGVPAALFMATSRTVMRTQFSIDSGPATTLERANRFVSDDVSTKLFLSAFCATLDTRNGRLLCANAGHDWPLWLHCSTGQIETVKIPGYLLGAFRNVKIKEREIMLEPGDTLILYTDGVTEARSPDGGFFGDEEQQATIETNFNAGAQKLLNAIVQAVTTFTAGRPPTDDLSLVVIKRQEDGGTQGRGDAVNQLPATSNQSPPKRTP